MAVHDGVTCLANAEHKKLFETTPNKYLPAYGGYCAYGLGVGKKFVADPEVWRIVNGILYLNLDKGIQEKWEKDVPGYIKKGDANWATIKDKKPLISSLNDYGPSLQSDGPSLFSHNNENGRGSFVKQKHIAVVMLILALASFGTARGGSETPFAPNVDAIPFPCSPRITPSGPPRHMGAREHWRTTRKRSALIA